MSLKNQLSFSSGELDPILHDRVTLGKFSKGLETARNVIVGKTGSIMSRFPRAHFVAAKNNNETIKLYSPPNSGILTEWGNLYVRLYDFDGNLIIELAHALLESDLPNMHFTVSGQSLYVFVAGKLPLDLLYLQVVPAFQISSALLAPLVGSPTGVVTATGAPTGYGVDYIATAVRNGEESIVAITPYLGTWFKPLVAGQDNTIVMTLLANYSIADSYNEFRVYRKPTAGGAYGYIGSTSDFYDVTGDLTADFIDLGGDADFTNGPPDIITRNGLDGVDAKFLYPKTGTVYQQRLLMTAEDDEEAIVASRPGFAGNFYRDFPLGSASALKFKSGTSGFAKVLRMIENDGLIVFTSTGVFVHVGALSPENISLEKKGSWVINESLPPLNVPGGVFFVDNNTNAIQQLVFNNDSFTYQTSEHSIFSNHLFSQKSITSWAYQDGVTPLILVTFSDGTFATFTYNSEHQMRAWSRHDSAYPLEQVEGTGVADSTFFVTNKDGQRYIEVSLPRRIPVTTFENNPEADKLNLNSFMDAVETKSNLLNDSLVGADVFTLVPVTPGDWENDLTLTCGTSVLFPSPGLGDVGTLFRFFDITDKTQVDLVVVARLNDNQVTVEPSAEFPSAQASGFRMYETFNVVTGLNHLEGENVGIFMDGYVVNSPYNDVEGYDPVVVVGGNITIPNGERGAIIIIGRPITADIKTLNISTVEQSPTMVESLNVNKLYIRFHETRGLYVSNDFPEESDGGKDGTSIVGMEDLDVFDVPPGNIIGNRYKQPASKRHEQNLPGNWESQGKISIRQVDPVHFEILSIIPDLEVLRRRN